MDDNAAKIQREAEETVARVKREKAKANKEPKKRRILRRSKRR